MCDRKRSQPPTSFFQRYFWGETRPGAESNHRHCDFQSSCTSFQINELGKFRFGKPPYEDQSDSSILENRHALDAVCASLNRPGRQQRPLTTALRQCRIMRRSEIQET
jgi:hypothetical protein